MTEKKFSSEFLKDCAEVITAMPLSTHHKAAHVTFTEQKAKVAAANVVSLSSKLVLA